MVKTKNLILLTCCLFLKLNSQAIGKEFAFAAQDTVDYGMISDGDTLIFQYVKEIEIIAPFHFKNQRQEKKYSRLEMDLRRIYPWAVFVSREVTRVDRELEKMPARKRKGYLKQFQKEVYVTYMDTLKTFSLRQGKLFLKLIDRESGRTPYELIRDYRNGWQAVLWSGLAFLAGGNLDADYDEEDEKMIEHIIRRIRAGDYD